MKDDDEITALETFLLAMALGCLGGTIVATVMWAVLS